MTDDLELKCKKAILNMANHLSDINHKIDHIIQTYREDYYTSPTGTYHHKQEKNYMP